MARLTLILTAMATVVYLLDGFRFALNEYRRWRGRVKQTGTWLGILLALCLVPAIGNSAVIPAASCSQADIQAAIDSSADNDQITVPAGTCSWLTGPGPTVPVTKGLELIGAGVGSTIINGNTWPLRIIAGNGKRSRVTGFDFQPTSSSVEVLQVVREDTAYGGNNIRIYNNKFGGKIYLNCYCYGLIDHNTFTASSVFSAIWVFENSADRAAGGGDGGTASFLRASSIATTEAWYIEDNTFTWSSPSIGFSVVDSRSGGRHVFRYNTVQNGNWTIHDARQSSEHGTRQYEVYGNTFTYTSAIQGSLYNWGSGTGVIFSNRFKTPEFTDGVTGIVLQNWRSTGGILLTQDPWKYDADGTAPNFCLGGVPHEDIGDCATPPYAGPSVAIDGGGAAGYPARDQIGRGVTNATSGVQDLEPVYFWDNYYCTGASGVCDPDPGVSGIYATPVITSAGNNPTHVQDGRDIYSNTTKPGYAAYTYPHPLQVGSSEPPARKHPGKGKRLLHFMELGSALIGMGWHFRKALVAGALSACAGLSSVAVVLPLYVAKATYEVKATSAKVIVALLQRKDS